MFEYGKDIPLEGVSKLEAAQPEVQAELQQAEEKVFSFDRRMEILLDGVSGK